MIRRTFLKAFAATPLVTGRGKKKMPFGNAVGEGFTGSSIVVAKKVLIEGPNGELLIYSSAPPALGNLIYSDVGTGITSDSVGNAIPANGATTYNDFLGTFFACSQTAGGLTFYTASSAGGPYTSQGSIGLPIAASELALLFTSVQLTNGATSIPISSAGVTTVAQVVSLLKSVGIFS